MQQHNIKTSQDLTNNYLSSFVFFRFFILTLTRTSNHEGPQSQEPGHKEEH